MVTFKCMHSLSFQDIVEDEDIKLDWLFKMSLIRDLVRVRFNSFSLCEVCFFAARLRIS